MPNRQKIRVERDMVDLRDHVLRMSKLAEAILEKSLRSVWTRDASLRAEVKHDDLAIDRIDVDIDDAVLRVLALDAPVASDLRLVVAIKAIATDLERVGDLARNIAGCGGRLASLPERPLPTELRKLADDSVAVLKNVNQAFASLDTDSARGVLAADDEIDDLEDQVIRDAIARLTKEPEAAEQEIDVIFIAQNLERVGDHATNIAEEVILAAEAKNLKHASKLGND